MFVADRRGTISSMLDWDARPRRSSFATSSTKRRAVRHRAFVHRLRGDVALATRLNRLLVMRGLIPREQR